MKVGIDAIAFYTPQHYVDMAELAVARGIEPEKFTLGLGQERMSIATPCEDTVHLAINASLKALRDFDIHPEDIGTLVVGTETGIDHSKPIAVYVHHALGLPDNCITYETKHACFGAMAAVTSVGDWIISGRAKGKKALIIAADIANYPVKSSAEPTQGAGAVAIVVSEDPNLCEFDRSIHGYFTKNVMDFWRPLYSKEAFADGHYSISCYLDALEKSKLDSGEKAPAITELAACLYHVPFVKMASKAHQKNFEVELGHAIEKGTPEFDQFKASFAEKTQPWLAFNSQVGNIYTASLFLSLINLLSSSELKAGETVSVFSYGSGCAASYSIFSLVEGYERWKAVIDPGSLLNERRKLSIAEYERVMSKRDEVIKESGVINPEDWDLTSNYLYIGNRNHIRQYSGLNIG